MAASLKNILGQVPGAAELYGILRPERPRTRYNLEQLRTHLPAAAAQSRDFAGRAPAGKRVMLFATLHYWIEQAAMIGLILRGMGHEVTIAYLPHSSWDKEINSFDLRRQDLYTRRVVAPLEGFVRFLSLLDVHPVSKISDALAKAVDSGAAFDTMYSTQAEEIDPTSSLFRLRLERNGFAARTAVGLLEAEQPQVVAIPNGLITELGIVYQAARSLGCPTVTYEFNDQREQIWISQNDIVMRQNTDALWKARAGNLLTDEQRAKMLAFEEARSGGDKYGKGTRHWQDGPRRGGDALRMELGLDSRPIVLLATNVLGDSLTLGRHLFAPSMAVWIARTVEHLAARPDIQLLIRVHPGERLIKGPSISRTIQEAMPKRAEHIHVIHAADTTNTYDLMELADLGVAYTTTVGMEMAMRGIPVLVAGATHYRARGFTMDPSSWDEYFSMMDEVLADARSHRLTAVQTELAWNYAYRFFFEYPFDFPWRLMHFWRDLEDWPVGRVLSPEGMRAFGRTFEYLAGAGIEW